MNIITIKTLIFQKLSTYRKTFSIMLISKIQLGFIQLRFKIIWFLEVLNYFKRLYIMVLDPIFDNSSDSKPFKND